MTNKTQKLIEHGFFFLILGAAMYLLWKVFSPFAGALALAAIIVTICYPIHRKVLKWVPRGNRSLAALTSVFIVLLIVILPLTLLASLISKEAFSIYTALSTSDHSSLVSSIEYIEGFIDKIAPGFTFNLAEILQQGARWVGNSFFSILAGTVSTVFLFFIALIGSYFFFKDGTHFTSYLIKLSPLNDDDDLRILQRLANAVRSVALGTLAIALLQGLLTAIGLFIFGFENSVLWGSVAALGALVPGVGTAVVLVPAVLYLFYQGQLLYMLLLAIWGVAVVGLVDNFLGPKIMSRGNTMHPFLILISVLGGLVYFGPLGFVLGPVILSLFLVLLELYDSHVKTEI